MAELTGKVLGGRYRVDAFLGRGGMADVYKVWDQQRAVFLALKVLHADLAGDRVFLRRFEHEAHTLARLQHPNIVRCYGLESAPEPLDSDAPPLAFILMDYIDGLTLRKEIFLNKAGLPVERALEVMRPVCAALFYAHQMGLAHCDIKPANIMLNRSGAVYLADFGIAHVSEASAQSPGGMGTPAYMAPEHLRGRQPNAASDIYALGVTLFEMLTGGKRPFAVDNLDDADAVAWEKEHLPPLSPRRFAPQITAEMEAVILRCLERKPERRYHTALDLLEALEAAAGQREDLDDLLTPAVRERDIPQTLAADPGGANPGVGVVEQLRGGGPGLPNRLRRILAHALPNRRSGWLWLAAALILAGVGLALLARDAHAPSLFTPPGLTLTDGKLTVSGLSARSTPPARAASGTPTAASGAASASGAARASAGSATATLQAPAKANPVGNPTPLGGSDWLAYAFDAGEGVVQVWVMQPGSPDTHRVITHEPGGACQPAWSPDGQKIAYTTPCRGPSVYYPGATIKVAHLHDEQVEPLPLTGAGVSAAFDPAWSPDGQTLAFTAIVGEQIRIHAYTFATGKVAVLAANGIKNAQPAWSPDGQHIAYITSDAQMRHPDALWLMGKNGDSQEAFSAAESFSAPAWSPDGRQVIVTVNRPGAAPALAVFERADPSQGARPLLPADFQPGLPVQGGVYSADGRWVAFWGGMAREREIYLTGADGQDIRQLTHNTLQDFQPAWSP